MVPFCGQKIESRKIPQELLKKGVQVGNSGFLEPLLKLRSGLGLSVISAP